MQQPINQAPGAIHAKLTISSSTELAHRAIIIAALADGVSEISALPLTPSVQTQLDALRELGIVTQLDNDTNSCIIAGCNGRLPKQQASVWCGRSKSALRFLLAACAATSGVIYFDAPIEKRHPNLRDFLNILIRQGVQLIPSDARKLPFTLISIDPLQGGEISLPDNLHEQTICALMMVAPFARSAFTFNLNQARHHPALDLTIDLMADFGVLAQRVHHGQYIIPVPQRYQAVDYTIEPNFTEAAYLLAAAAMTGGDISIQACSPSESKQQNAKFISYLEQMGCQIQKTPAALTLTAPEQLTGIEISLPYFSDIFAILASIATFADSPTYIAHVGKMSRIEYERFIIIKTELVKLGIHVETGDNWMRIFPSTPSGTLLKAHDDHIVAKALALIGLCTPGVSIDYAETISDRFSNYFPELNKLAASATVKA